MKRKMARKYARDYEPARALVQMEKDEVPIDLRPPVYLLQNYRPSRAQQTEKQVADSIASLEAFVARPPSQLVVEVGDPCITAQTVRIPFCYAEAETCLASTNLGTFVADFTFETNYKSLVLGAQHTMTAIAAGKVFWPKVHLNGAASPVRRAPLY